MSAGPEVGEVGPLPDAFKGMPADEALEMLNMQMTDAMTAVQTEYMAMEQDYLSKKMTMEAQHAAWTEEIEANRKPEEDEESDAESPVPGSPAGSAPGSPRAAPKTRSIKLKQSGGIGAFFGSLFGGCSSAGAKGTVVDDDLIAAETDSEEEA